MKMNSDSEDEDISMSLDLEILEESKVPSVNLLPEKSRKKYESVYNLFMDWRSVKNVDSLSESVLLAYFEEISEKYKSSSLWALYSMLRSTLIVNNGVNIEKYTELRAFLKQKSKGYRPKKGKTFTPDEINKFINEAPDSIYLATKVALIMGIMGACRAKELHSLNIEDIQDLGSAMLVTVLQTKTEVFRKFTITDHFYDICKKYAILRPANALSNSFFLNYQKGKCTIQKIGINKFGAMGKQIATFLNLPDPGLYTGHCFRRTSATPLVEVSNRLRADALSSAINSMDQCTRKQEDDSILEQSFQSQFDGVRVGIVHLRYPEYVLSNDQLGMLQSSIMKAIEQIPDDGPQVRFQGCTQQAGWLLITCADQTSALWLERVIISLQPWEGACLSFVQGQDLPKQHICTAFIPDDAGNRLTSEEVLTRLRKMNHGLNTKEWVVLDREESGPGQMWTFLIDDMSIMTLKGLDNKPYFGFGQVQFHMKIKNETGLSETFQSSGESQADIKPNVSFTEAEDSEPEELVREKSTPNQSYFKKRNMFKREDQETLPSSSTS